jgi:hypothetical protein
MAKTNRMCVTIHSGHIDTWNERVDQPMPLPAISVDLDYVFPEAWLDQFKYVIWSIEEGGNTDRLHLQMYVQAKKAIRLAAWRELCPGHLEMQQATNEEARNYCKKTDDVTFRLGPWEHGVFASGQGKRSDLEAAKEAALGGATIDEMMEHHTAVMMRGASVMKHLMEMARKKTVRRPTEFNFPGGNKEWHRFILHVCEQPVDHRKIYWVYDHVGNSGKSYLASHICTKYKTFLAAEGTYKDLMFAYGEMGCPGVVIMDIPRTGKVGDPQCVESWKNGAAFSSKYMSTMLEFNVPHVFIFSNESCQPGVFSDDRLVRIELAGGEWTDASRALAMLACPNFL